MFQTVLTLTPTPVVIRNGTLDVRIENICRHPYNDSVVYAVTASEQEAHFYALLELELGDESSDFITVRKNVTKIELKSDKAKGRGL